MGPPLAAGIAAIAAVLGLLIARHAATHGGTAFRDRRVWLVGAPMLFSAVGFLVVGLVVLPEAPILAALIGGWGVVEIAMVAIVLPRSRRSDGPRQEP